MDYSIFICLTYCINHLFLSEVYNFASFCVILKEPSSSQEECDYGLAMLLFRVPNFQAGLHCPDNS
jgi:hypothetical protein